MTALEPTAFSFALKVANANPITVSLSCSVTVALVMSPGRLKSRVAVVEV